MSSSCLTSSVYYSLEARTGFLCRIGNIAELGRVHLDSVEYDPRLPTAARLLPKTPPILELCLLCTEPKLVVSFQAAFTRLFGREIKLWMKDVAGYRIAYEEPKPMRLSVFRPLVIVLIDTDTTHRTELHVEKSGVPTLRHILGHRVLILEEGIMYINVKSVCLFMFEIR